MVRLGFKIDEDRFFQVVLPLRQRLENHGRRSLMRIGILCVRHHADDLVSPDVFLFVDSEVTADGILSREKLLGKGLIDHRNQGCVLIVAFTKPAAANQCLATASRNFGLTRLSNALLSSFGFRQRLSGKEDAAGPFISIERAVHGQPGIVHSGNRPQLQLQPPLQSSELLLDR